MGDVARAASRASICVRARRCRRLGNATAKPRTALLGTLCAENRPSEQAGLRSPKVSDVGALTPVIEGVGFEVGPRHYACGCEQGSANPIGERPVRKAVRATRPLGRFKLPNDPLYLCAGEAP